jgi:hypothetical protein
MQPERFYGVVNMNSSGGTSAFGLSIDASQVKSHTIAPLSSLAAPQVAPDGSRFYSDNAGKLVFAEYSTGAIVCIHPHMTAVRTTGGDHWVVDASGFSYRLD